jgi:hypothetical protein
MLNQQQFHPRPMLEEPWKRPYELLPSLANVENTDDPLKREKSVPADYETSEDGLVRNNEHTIAYTTHWLLPGARETEKVSKALALIDEAVSGDVENEDFDEERQ